MSPIKRTLQQHAAGTNSSMNSNDVQDRVGTVPSDPRPRVHSILSTCTIITLACVYFSVVFFLVIYMLASLISVLD